MNAASGLPGRTTGRGAHTTAYAYLEPQALPPQASIIGSRAPASRTPPAPLTRPGSARSF